MTSIVLGYLDPGTGSIIFQFIAVALMSAGVFFRNALSATVGRFIGRFRKSKDA